MSNLLRVKSPQPPRRSAPTQYFVQVFGANRSFNWGDCRALNQSFAVKVTLGDETQSNETTLKPPHSVDWNCKLVFMLPTPAVVDANNNNPDHPIKLQVTFKSDGSSLTLATNEVIKVGTARSTTRELLPAQELSASNKKWVKLYTPNYQWTGASILITAGFVQPSGSTPKIKTPEPTTTALKAFKVVGHNLVPQWPIRNRHGSGGQPLRQAVQTTEESKRRSGSLRDVRPVDELPTGESAVHRSLRVRFTSTPDLAAIAARRQNDETRRVLFESSETFTVSPARAFGRANPVVVPPVGLVPPLPTYGNVSMATGVTIEKKQDDQEPSIYF